MAISDRKLEEDEAKIDNLLHKVIECDSRVEYLINDISTHTTDTFILEKIKMIRILTETINHLTYLADEIDVDDEKLLKQIQLRIGQAIRDIKKTEDFLG